RSPTAIRELLLAGDDGGGYYRRGLIDIVSTDEFTHFAATLLVSPNPVFTKLLVNVPSEFNSKTLSSHIFNSVGRRLSSTRLQGSQESFSLPVRNFKPGTYFILLEDGSKRALAKFIKE
ncbi:MAG: T9SS type A sorting domain-containing protein, partial [Bacteroidota bacterium]